ncbi:hypothetical protein D3C76_162810 [compost metagenome]
MNPSEQAQAPCEDPSIIEQSNDEVIHEWQTLQRCANRAKELKGQLVCITLNNGRSYTGWIAGLGKGRFDPLHPGSPPWQIQKKINGTHGEQAIGPFRRLPL